MSKKTTRVQLELSAAEQRAEDAARLGKIYGSLLPDVQLLQSRGYAVTREGKAYQVGNKTLDREGVIAMAARERRLAGVPEPSTVRKVATTASGLKVGDTVAKTARAVSAAAQRKLSPVKAKEIVPKAPDHSKDLGAKPRVVWLDLGLLKVDGSYQRDVGEGGACPHQPHRQGVQLELLPADRRHRTRRWQLCGDRRPAPPRGGEETPADRLAALLHHRRAQRRAAGLDLRQHQHRAPGADQLGQVLGGTCRRPQGGSRLG